MVRLVLLDRDGVLNRDRADFVKSPDELVMLPGAADAVARLTRAGVRVVVCTNQSAVGRGLIDVETLSAIHDKLRREVEAAVAGSTTSFMPRPRRGMNIPGESRMQACLPPPWRAMPVSLSRHP